MAHIGPMSTAELEQAGHNDEGYNFHIKLFSISLEHKRHTKIHFTPFSQAIVTAAATTVSPVSLISLVIRLRNVSKRNMHHYIAVLICMHVNV